MLPVPNQKPQNFWAGLHLQVRKNSTLSVKQFNFFAYISYILDNSHAKIMFQKNSIWSKMSKNQPFTYYNFSLSNCNYSSRVQCCNKNVPEEAESSKRNIGEIFSLPPGPKYFTQGDHSTSIYPNISIDIYFQCMYV